MAHEPAPINGLTSGFAPGPGRRDKDSRASRPGLPSASTSTSAPASASGAALAASLLGFFVITLDALIVNVALPTIGAGLGGGITVLQWIVDGYTLMFAALVLFAGTLSDRFGARQTYGAGMALFVAASAACGLAPTAGALVAARLLQGAGAAVMLPATLALLREAYPDPARRTRAVALWAMGGAVASAAGPVLGGALSVVSWRLIFFVNLPVGVVALLLLRRVARSPRRPVPFDWTGQAAAILAMAGLTFGTIEGGAHGFAAPRVLVALAVAVAAALVWRTAQVRGRHPMVPPDLFRSARVVTAVASGFAFTVGFYGLVFLLSLYFQQVRGLTAYGTGLLFLPMTAVTAGMNLVSGKVTTRLGAKVPMAAGQAVMAFGLVLLCAAPVSTPVWVMALLMIPVGAGGALSVPAMTALLLDSVPAERAGTAGGVLNTARQVGAALSVAVFGALVANRHQFLPGLRAGLLVGAALLLATALAAGLLPAIRGVSRGAEATPARDVHGPASTGRPESGTHGFRA